MKHFGQVGQQSRGNLTWRSLLGVVVAALAGVAFGRNVLGTVSVVYGPSMSPTYAPGAHVLTYPVLSPIRRSDVVILDDGNERYAVKRVIGLPGETVQLWHGRVFVNRRMLREPYLPKHTYTCPLDGRKTSETVVLKDDQYMVMGDNRACSSDSRIYGPVDENQIKRRVPLPKDYTRALLADSTTPPPPQVTLHARVAN
jgi:signal peptidase I